MDKSVITFVLKSLKIILLLNMMHHLLVLKEYLSRHSITKFMSTVILSVISNYRKYNLPSLQSPENLLNDKYLDGHHRTIR